MTLAPPSRGGDAWAVALVTGGSSGIGLACVEALQREGLLVAVVDREPTSAAEWSTTADVRDAAELVRAVAAVEYALGPVTHLVTAAGYYESAAIDALDFTKWNDMLAVHVGGTAAALHAALPGMVARRYGAACAIGSELGLCGDPSAPHYAAAKGAIHALVKSVAVEIAPLGVRLNAVAPGPTDTPLLRDDPNVDAYAGTLPLGRVLDPEEIAAAVCFVLLEETNLVGQVVSPNAGAVI